MKRRRAERCLLRAEAALQAGFEDDARAALAEASRLDPSVSGLWELQQRLSLSPAPPAIDARRRRRLLISVAAGAALMMGAALAWQAASPVAEPAAGHEPAPAPATGGDIDTAPANVVRIRYTDIVPILQPTLLLANEPDSRTDVEPAKKESETAVVTTASSSPSPAPEPPPPEAVTALPELPVTRAELPASLTASAPPPAVPALRNAAPAPVVTTASAPPPPPAVDERARIRSVLSRYEAAYSGLDASAAHEVWPAVDQRALARAFNGLQSQQLSLGDCDVTVDGTIARAECAGSASWTPKVGSGRTEPRRWAFDLRNKSGLWQIVRADVRE